MSKISSQNKNDARYWSISDIIHKSYNYYRLSLLIWLWWFRKLLVLIFFIENSFFTKSNYRFNKFIAIIYQIISMELTSSRQEASHHQSLNSGGATSADMHLLNSPPCSALFTNSLNSYSTKNKVCISDLGLYKYLYNKVFFKLKMQIDLYSSISTSFSPCWQTSLA